MTIAGNSQPILVALDAILQSPVGAIQYQAKVREIKSTIEVKSLTGSFEGVSCEILLAQ
jgi:hypothetical protein